MCGIAGILSWSRPPDPALVHRMCAALAHRGPDAAGVHSDGPISLGHRRLSIIDLDVRSNQPMFDHTGRYATVFNGEIYNFRAVRSELEEKGHGFRTSGDTEVILEAFKEWGIACVERLNGMFAFAIWDKDAERIWLARDRAGEKPLYFMRSPDGGIAFASELTALALVQAGGRTPDPEALDHYLRFNYLPPHQSMLRGIEKLPPAHWLTVAKGSPPRIERYWDLRPHFANKRSGLSLAEAADELRGLLDDAVGMRTVSDVALGTFLSSGLDSSAVTASMAAAVGREHVRAYSLSFESEGFDEAVGAADTARALGIEHQISSMGSRGDDDLVRIADRLDEPLADTSFFPTFELCRTTRRYVTVALGGDGADELFAGYPTCNADILHRWLSSVPAFVWRSAARALDRLPPRPGKVAWDFKLRQFMRGASAGWPSAHTLWRQILSPSEVGALLRPEWRSAAPAAERYDPAGSARGLADAHVLDQAMLIDLNTWLPDSILTKVDRASMASSLEVRAPFLDHRLMEYAASLDVGLRWRLFRGKRVLRASQRTRLPTAVVQGRKQGFNAPFAAWFSQASPAIRDVMLAPAKDDPYRQDVVSRYWDEHLAGRRDNHLILLNIFVYRRWWSRVSATR